jgi:hypothetical protein
MKSPIKVLKTMILLLMASCLFAGNTNPLADINKSGSKSFVLNLKDNTAKKVRIQLEDANGHILLTQRINTMKKKAMKYNLNNLPDGTYTLSVSDKQAVLKNEVIIQDGTLNIEDEHGMFIYKPQINVKSNQVEFSLLQLNDTKTKIRILDATNNLVFSEDIKDVGSIHRRYDLSLLLNGKYLFTLETNDELFTKAVRISPSSTPRYLRVKSAVSSTGKPKELILN